jgi:hypothetical protein
MNLTVRQAAGALVVPTGRLCTCIPRSTGLAPAACYLPRLVPYAEDLLCRRCCVRYAAAGGAAVSFLDWHWSRINFYGAS